MIWDLPYISWIVWAVTIAYDIYTDTRKRPTATTWVDVRHFRGAILRIPSFIVMGLFAHWEWWGMLAFSYQSLFNMGWNLTMKLPPFRKGTTSFLDKYTPVWLPWVLLIPSIVFYVTR